MSSPLSSLQKGKKTPILSGSRAAPFKHAEPDDDLVSQLLMKNDFQVTKKSSTVSKVSANQDLMSSMLNRLALVEKKLNDYELTIKEKDKRIKVLEEKCEIYRKAQGYGCDQVAELEKKCHKLQSQIHSMEEFLEDYGMIWVGKNDSSDDENDDDECDDDEEDDVSLLQNESTMWSPGLSVTPTRKFNMDYNLFLQNIKELNQIAGEGEHYIKHTKDGATLQLKEPVPLTLYSNGIFMFGGPFRPFEDPTTQTCMQDIMDGYFPTELQASYPDGVPFKVQDKREVYFKDKRLEKLFPGQGHALSPEKNKDLSSTKDGTSINGGFRVETSDKDYKQSVESFLSKLPVSVVKSGKIVDVRAELKETLQGSTSKNDVILVETEVVGEMKTRLLSGRRSRPQSSCGVTTLRIKSETGDKTYILKMKYTNTVADVRHYLVNTLNMVSSSFDLKTSFPKQTYSNENSTLKDYGLVPNATLYIVPRK